MLALIARELVPRIIDLPEGASELGVALVRLLRGEREVVGLLCDIAHRLAVQADHAVAELLHGRL